MSNYTVMVVQSYTTYISLTSPQCKVASRGETERVEREMQPVQHGVEKFREKHSSKDVSER